MYVHSRLASGFSNVYTNIVAIGRMLHMDRPVCLVEKRKNRRLFFGGHIKKVRDVPSRHYENVSPAKGATIVTNIRQRVLKNHIARGTQFACRRFIGHGGWSHAT